MDQRTIPLDNIIGNSLSPEIYQKTVSIQDHCGAVSIRELSKVEPKNIKMAVIEVSVSEPCKMKFHESDRLEVIKEAMKQVNITTEGCNTIAMSGLLCSNPLMRSQLKITDI
ncbi:hypothetical protein Tco_0493187 [Tanacetum coccineum]